MHEFKERHPLVTDLLVLHRRGAAAAGVRAVRLLAAGDPAATGLLWSWDGATPAGPRCAADCSDWGMFGFGIYWIFHQPARLRRRPGAVRALATFVVVLIMALYPALAGWLLGRWGPPPGPNRWLLVIPALWTLLDWVRSWLFTGFPWLAPATVRSIRRSANSRPISAYSASAGRCLFSAGLLWTALNIAATGETAGLAGIAGDLWLGAWGWGRSNWVEPAGTPLRIAMVQGNIAQDQKWEPNTLDER
jgi:apolipoprotein N-acyltransferase